ncbi:hypothetical protein RJT34_07775 [Clitoria ternatea]|uniref:RING-type domain-containing protein n=1 Tax=Clitoria ternatea TaxID=43366 RepID=A0AAN9PTP8_CLITE
MSSHPVRSWRRRNLDLNFEPRNLDLNFEPPIEDDEEHETGQSSPQQPEVPIIDVEAIDDDVVESSPRSFAQATSNSRRVRRRSNVMDLESEDQHNETDLQNQTIINSGSSIPLNENAKKSPERQPPKEPVFNCPICVAPFTEEMSTRCGHIFCNKCITSAISAEAKCPTCGKKVTLRDLIRVFFPATIDASLL